jgi:hypothetical protein
MQGRFRRWQGEDQPAVAGVNGRKSQNVAAESAVRLGVLAVDDYVRAIDHRTSSFHPIDKYSLPFQVLKSYGGDTKSWPEP